MSASDFRLSGRPLAWLAAASVLAAFSSGAQAYGSEGRIALQTAKDLSNFHFRLEKDNGSGTWVDQGVQQGFTSLKGCTITAAASPQLVDLAAYRGGGAGTLGYVSTSIGVHDGPQGTACGRVSTDKGEAIGAAIGSYFGASGPNAFDRLEIDIEAKGDVALRLDVTFDGFTRSYFLYAGSSIVGSADPDGTELDPSSTSYDCSASTDSGPDSGPSDNCRWIINDIGRSFRITPLSGEFSLEGGGDFDNIIANRTYIYLTKADGILDCGDTVTTGDASGVACSITRLDAPGEACVPVPYVFRSDTATRSCTLSADMGSQQLVANLFVRYNPEVSIDPVVSINQLTAWLPSGLSRVAFDNDPAATADYPIPPCLGLTLTNVDADASPPTGPDPIPEIAAGGYDWVGGNDTTEFACAFMRREVYGTTSFGAPQTTVEEGLQFWGDITFSRTQPGQSN